MDRDERITFECPNCGSHDIRFPDTRLSGDPATCARCNRTYAYGDMLEVASRLMTLLATERRRSEKLLSETRKARSAE